MSHTPPAFDAEEFEEISSVEVDRTVSTLDRMAMSAKSENIRLILETAANQIYDLVYMDETQAVDPNRHAA